VQRRPARSLVYATDLADTGENRRRLVKLARGADVLICEAGFAAADAAQARRTGHLTARACGEIAALAGARRLVPFHLSRRYEQDPSPVYDEVEAAFGARVQRAGGVGSAGKGWGDD
jgi:ribonuclease BN (tRNA processing enzyme)